MGLGRDCQVEGLCHLYLSQLTKLKEMVPGDKLCESLHCPWGHFPNTNSFHAASVALDDKEQWLWSVATGMWGLGGGRVVG